MVPVQRSSFVERSFHDARLPVLPMLPVLWAALRVLWALLHERTVPITSPLPLLSPAPLALRLLACSTALRLSSFVDLLLPFALLLLPRLFSLRLWLLR